MWPFKKPIKVQEFSTASFTRLTGYQQVWERQTLPDPGAMVYSYETLQLFPLTPIGPTVATRHYDYFNPYHTPMYVNKAVPITGMPTVAGSIAYSPLLSQAVVQ